MNRLRGLRPSLEAWYSPVSWIWNSPTVFHPYRLNSMILHENVIFMGSPANSLLVEKTDESGFHCRGRGVALMGGGDKGLAKAINGEGGGREIALFFASAWLGFSPPQKSPD